MTRRSAALLPRVTCEQDPEIEAEFPANMSGKVTVLAAGRSYAQARWSSPRASHANFLTEAELRAKFAGLTEAVLGRARSAALADAVLQIDRMADVSGLAQLSQPAQMAA